MKHQLYLKTHTLWKYSPLLKTGGGVGLWAKNFDALASIGRPVLAIDVLGFGRSSRFPFSTTDDDAAESALVTSLDLWREAQGIDRMALIGHSFGGYQVGAYAIKHPEHVDHLVFVDPWGFPPRPNDDSASYRLPVSIVALSN